MFERFTKDARAVVVGAQGEARRLGAERIGVEHLLLAALGSAAPQARVLSDEGLDARRLEALATPPGGLDPEALRAIGIDLDQVRGKADEVFGVGALDAPRRAPRGHIPFTPDAKKVLELALREAIHLGDRDIRLEHVLLGATRPRTAGGDLLVRCGVEPAAVRAALLAARDAA